MKQYLVGVALLLVAAISIVPATADVPHTCAAIPHCLTCPYDGKTFTCTACEHLYAINEEGKCTACSDIDGCWVCRSMVICDKCRYPTKYGPDQQGVATCSPCAPNCRNCTVGGSGTCDYCQPGFYVDSNKQCSNCTANCKICQPGAIGSTTCSVCNDGYTNNGGTTACVAQPSQPCGTNCGICVNGFCQQCADGGKISPSGSCVCAPNCNSCVNNHYGYCDDGQCQAGYKGTADKICVKATPLSSGD